MVDKILFGFGAITSGLNCVQIAIDHHLFSNLPNIIFMCVFIAAIAALGGAGMLLVKDYFYEKHGRAWKRKI